MQTQEEFELQSKIKGLQDKKVKIKRIQKDNLQNETQPILQKQDSLFLGQSQDKMYQSFQLRDFKEIQTNYDEMNSINLMTQQISQQVQNTQQNKEIPDFIKNILKEETHNYQRIKTKISIEKTKINQYFDQLLQTLISQMNLKRQELLHTYEDYILSYEKNYTNLKARVDELSHIAPPPYLSQLHSEYSGFPYIQINSLQFYGKYEKQSQSQKVTEIPFKKKISTQELPSVVSQQLIKYLSDLLTRQLIQIPEFIPTSALQKFSQDLTKDIQTEISQKLSKFNQMLSQAKLPDFKTFSLTPILDLQLSLDKKVLIAPDLNEIALAKQEKEIIKRDAQITHMLPLDKSYVLLLSSVIDIYDISHRCVIYSIPLEERPIQILHFGDSVLFQFQKKIIQYKLPNFSQGFCLEVNKSISAITINAPLIYIACQNQVHIYEESLLLHTLNFSSFIKQLYFYDSLWIQQENWVQEMKGQWVGRNGDIVRIGGGYWIQQDKTVFREGADQQEIDSSWVVINGKATQGDYLAIKEQTCFILGLEAGDLWIKQIQT